MIKRPPISAQMRLEVFKRHGATVACAMCKVVKPIADMQLDHHLALINGGEHTVEELRPVCSAPDCHPKKSATEHRENCRAKRLAKAKAVHDAVVAKMATRAPSKIKSRPFPKQQRGFR
jgi:hypothetical protein